MNENRADEAQRLVDKFEAKRGAFVKENDQLHTTVRGMAEQISKLRLVLHDNEEKAGTQWAEFAENNKAITAVIESRYNQTQNQIAAINEDADKRFRAVGNAVGAFADILHVSNPLVAY